MCNQQGWHEDFEDEAFPVELGEENYHPFPPIDDDEQYDDEDDDNDGNERPEVVDEDDEERRQEFREAFAELIES